MSEKPMCNLCKASVMVYDDAEKKWKTAGRTPGLSCVSIYRHMTENTFRVIGRKEQDGEVVINCAVIPQLKYNRATPTFHQWRDGVRTVYGLNFSTADEANTFASCMESALDMLRTGGGGSPQPPAGPSPAEIEAKRQEELERQRQEREKQEREKQERERQERELQERERQERERQERERQERERQERERAENERIARERAAAAVPQAAAPAPPPPPPSGGGAPPPPPPPPPPPSGTPAPPNGGSSNQGGLAAALQAAKLKKAAAPERTESAPPPPSGGGGGGMDMMAELQKKMQRRRAAAQDSGDTGKPAPANIAPAPKPTSNSVGDSKRPAWQKSNSNSLNASPSVSSKKTGSSSDLDQLKQEILSEMKSEMQKMKEEILEAIREMNC